MTLKEYTLRQLKGYDEKIAQPQFNASVVDKVNEDGVVIAKQIIQGKNPDGTPKVIGEIPIEQIEMEDIDFEKEWDSIVIENGENATN